MWPNLFFPYITGKNFAFRILVEVAVLCYVLLALREPKYRPRSSYLMWAALGFVGWMAVATVFSVDPVKSFWSNFERMEGYVGLVHLFAWFVVAGAVLTAEKLWDRFFNTSIAVSTVQGMWAVFQALGLLSISTQSGARADTTFGNATYLAVYLLINFFLTLYMLARTGGTRSPLRYYYGAALLLQFAGVYLTETRGALLGLVGGVIVAALWVALRATAPQARALRRGALWVLGGVALLVVAFFIIRATPLVNYSSTLQRLAAISLEDRTTQSRFIIWSMALEGVAQRPLTGWGQENFSYVFNEHYRPEMYNQESWFDRAHNQFIDWLIAGGVPAFLLYLSLYVLAAWATLRSTELSVGEQAAFLGLLAGYAFNNLFVFDNLVSGIYFFAILAYLHSVSRHHKPSLLLSRPMSDHMIAIAAPVVLVAGLCAMWALNAPAMARASLLVNALQTQEAGQNSSGVTVGVAKDPKKNLSEFTEALGPVVWPSTLLGVQETTEQLLQYASAAAGQSSVNPQVKTDLFNTAVAAINALLESRPGDARLELFAGTFLTQFGQTAEGMAHLRKALEASPRKQQIQIQIGLTLLQTGDNEGALEMLQAAYEAAPGYDAARIYYAAGLYATANATQADALLTERFGSSVVDNNQLLQVFMGLKLYDRVIAVHKLRVEAAPEDSQVHLGLASVYFAACRIPEVLAELKVIARLQPQSALEMQNLTKQIQDGTLKCGQ